MLRQSIANSLGKDVPFRGTANSVLLPAHDGPSICVRCDLGHVAVMRVLRNKGMHEETFARPEKLTVAINSLGANNLTQFERPRRVLYPTPDDEAAAVT